MTSSKEPVTDGSRGAGQNDGVDQQNESAKPVPETAKEIGGRKGPDPTRYGDWEKNGRCIDF